MASKKAKKKTAKKKASVKKKSSVNKKYSDDTDKSSPRHECIVRSIQPHYLLPDHEVIEYLSTRRDEPDYLEKAIQLRVHKIRRSKDSHDVNCGAPMPPPPNIMEIKERLPYIQCTAKKHYMDGMAWLRANDNEKAIECFNFAVAIRPNDYLIQYDLGLSLLVAKRFKEGVSHLAKAIEINAYTSLPHEALAAMHAEKGDVASAIEILLHAPTSATMLTAIAGILSMNEKHAELEREVLDLAIELRPDYYLTHHRLAHLLGDLGEIDAAIMEAELALKLKPDDANTAILLGHLKYNAGALEESKYYFLIAQRSQPLNTTIRHALNQLEAELRNPGDADVGLIDPKKVSISRRLPKGTILKFIRSDKPGHISIRLRLPAQKDPCEFTDLPVKNGVVVLPLTIVFLCHSRQDRPSVEKIAEQLQSVGFYVWIDKKDLLPGDAWEEVIEDAIETANFVLVSLSQRSLKKEGYYWREIRYALKQRELRPEGEKFIIPVMIEKVDIPKSFSGIHCEDLTQPGWIERLALAMSPEHDKD